MNRNNDFMIKIMNLSDSDLEKIYQMACQRLKDEKASGKDTSETEQKLTIISAERIRRRKKEINEPEKMNPEIKDPEKNPEEINDPEKMNPEIKDPEKNPEKIIDPGRGINPEIKDRNREKIINKNLKSLPIKETEEPRRTHSSSGDEER